MKNTSKLMHKSFFSLIIILILSNCLRSQTINYDEFTLPDLNVQGFSGFSDFYSHNDTISNLSTMAIKSNASYFKLQNSRRKQRFTYAVLNFSYYNIKDLKVPATYDTERYFLYGNYFNEKRKFKPFQNPHKAYFWEFNQILNINNLQIPQSTGGFSEKRDFDIYMRFPIKYGRGKIEPLAMLAIAEFLSADLKDAGLIESLLSEDDLFNLTRRIVSVINERVFDKRKARMYQLFEISNWFYENNIPNNIISFSILNDNLFFINPVIERGHGKQNTFSFEPVLLQLNIGDENLQPFLGFGLFYSFNKQINISKKKHHDFRFKTGFDVQPYENIGGFFLMNSSYTLSYMPNSRTLLILRPKVDYYQFAYSTNNVILSLNASLSYFINYNLRVDASIDCYYHEQKNKDITNPYFPSSLIFDFSEPVFYRTMFNHIPFNNLPVLNTNTFFSNITLTYNIY